MAHCRHFLHRKVFLLRVLFVIIDFIFDWDLLEMATEHDETCSECVKSSGKALNPELRIRRVGLPISVMGAVLGVRFEVDSQ